MHELRQATLEKRKKSEGLRKRQTTLISEISEKNEYVEAETPTEVDVEGDSPQQQTLTDTDYDDTLHASEHYEAADTEREQTVATRTAAHSGWSDVEQEERTVLKGLVEWYKGDGYATAQESNDKASYTIIRTEKQSN